MTKFALFVAATVAMVVVASASDSTDKKEVRQSVRWELCKTRMGVTNATRKKSGHVRSEAFMPR